MQNVPDSIQVKRQARQEPALLLEFLPRPTQAIGAQPICRGNSDALNLCENAAGVSSGKRAITTHALIVCNHDLVSESVDTKFIESTSAGVPFSPAQRHF